MANNVCCPCFGVVFLDYRTAALKRLWFYSLSRRGNNSQFFFSCVAAGFLPRDVLLAFFSCSCVGRFSLSWGSLSKYSKSVHLSASTHIVNSFFKYKTLFKQKKSSAKWRFYTASQCIESSNIIKLRKHTSIPVDDANVFARTQSFSAKIMKSTQGLARKFTKSSSDAVDKPDGSYSPDMVNKFSHSYDAVSRK